MKNIALITGATGGLGQEFVKLHAQRKGDLVLVAREQEALNNLKEKVEKEYGVEATPSPSIYHNMMPQSKSIMS